MERHGKRASEFDRFMDAMDTAKRLLMPDSVRSGVTFQRRSGLCDVRHHVRGEFVRSGAKITLSWITTSRNWRFRRYHPTQRR